MSETRVLSASRSGTPMRWLRDSATLTVRSMRLSMRRIDALLTALLLPIMIMLIFVYLFGGAIHVGVSYVTYVVPGVILLCLALGSSTTAVSVNDDMTRGIVDRFKSLDISATAFVASHVAASVMRNLASTALVIGVALLIGFRPHANPQGWLAILGLVLLVVVAVSWVSAAFGLLVRSPEAASAFTFVVLFVPYVSSGFVPISTLPSWLRGFAQHQPATPVINTIRRLLLHQPIGASAWLTVAWCTGILLVSVVLCSLFFRRRTV